MYIPAFDNMLSVELNGYGFEIDSEILYLAIEWRLIILSVVGVTLYKVIKRKRAK